MKMPWIAKIPVQTIAWSVLAGVIAGLLLFGGQHCLREMEKRAQQRETKRYVDQLERKVSRNPIRVFSTQASDELPTVRPMTNLVENTREAMPIPFWVSVDWVPNGELEGYLTTEVIEHAREEGRFGSIRFALDRLSVHLDARTGLISENDRYVLNTIMLDMRDTVSRHDRIRASIAEHQEGKYAVGIAEPLASHFFNRLRESLDWLRD